MRGCLWYIFYICLDYLREIISPSTAISLFRSFNALSNFVKIASPIRLKPSCCVSKRNKPIFSAEIFCLKSSLNPWANSSSEIYLISRGISSGLWLHFRVFTVRVSRFSFTKSYLDFCAAKPLKARSWRRECIEQRATTMRRWRTVGASMGTTSFLYSMGFMRPLSVKRPVCNLVRAIYFAEA